jgi:transcriptional regulator with XRE-family HTH domain
VQHQKILGEFETGAPTMPVVVARLRIRPDVLRRKRLDALLSRRELADRSGISLRRLEELEAGSGKRAGVTPETVRALARALRCPANELAEVVD